ncbi:serine/threonine-protein kinase [Streptomyces sp. NPDC041068]|uniref:serine/threonine-protein kinase n=1 Tax=Streptomyces sp. NPDC041068 TaxID=3155130 RepID=UPI0033C8BE79
MSGPGDVVDGRFELLERLGSGGMGTVWRARDTVLHREVALKEVRSAGPDPAAEDSAVLRERVLREARALARLNHPHVVTIHQIIDTAADSHPWLVMELLPGRTLQDLLEERTLPPQEAARIGRELLSALRVAHAAGILHRDIKPANVLLRGPEDAPSVVLTDFGIASLSGATRLTATGDLIGSPEYIAPERIRGTGEGPAADLWSLGLVLYVAVEGVSPLRRATTLATLAAVLDDPLPPPVRSGPLAPVLAALLVRDPALRPDADRLDAMLAAVAQGIARQPTETAERPAVTVGPPPPSPPPSPEPRRRMPVVAAAVAVALALVAGAALVFALRDGSGTEGKGGEKGSTEADSVPASASRTSPEKPSKSPETSATTTPAKSTSPTSPTPTEPPASGTWIAQLFSEPDTSGTATRDRRLAAVRKDVPEARYLHSDDYASLRPGFWVIYAPGPFADGRAALRFCAERGRTTGNTCVGRYLSRDSADYSLQCKPPASNPVGRCTRA